MTRFLVAGMFLSVVLSSCMSVPPVFTQSGDRYKLPLSELAQINRLVASRPDLRKPIGDITMEDASHAQVRSGPTWTMRAKISAFKIYKRDGQWFIDESSIRDVENIFTS